MKITIDNFSDLNKIDNNLYMKDFSKSKFLGINDPKAIHVDEHWHSVYVLESMMNESRKAETMCSLITTLNLYPFASIYSDAVMLIESKQPKNNIEDRFDNVGAVETVREFPSGYLHQEFSKVNNRNKIPFVCEKKNRWEEIRFLDTHVDRALKFGLLPKNSLFCVLKPLQMIAIKSINFPNMGKVVFRYDEIKKIWADLEHSFLTWQLLNGILRGCRFMMMAGAANLFSSLPVEMLYIDEFSDQMKDESVRVLKERQLDLYGTQPLIHQGNAKEMIEIHKRSGINTTIWERPDKGYLNIPKMSELMEVIQNPNRKSPDLNLPDFLRKEIL